LRYFLRRHTPPFKRVLLVESGSRHLIEKAIASLRYIYGEDLEIDLVTCFEGEPEGIGRQAQVWRVPDYPGPEGRARLWSELTARGFPAVGILCAAEPIMVKWKWWLALKLPSKIFIINENGDFFWLDRGHWRTILEFMLYRAGLTGAGAVPALARLLFFPVTLGYLLLYAATVHLRRRIRLL
jgi:hypothetical protein